MTRSGAPTVDPRDFCLSEEDFYDFVTQAPPGKTRAALQDHLASCPECRNELACLLKLLHPEPNGSAAAPLDTPAEEVSSLLRLIDKSAQPRRSEGIRHAGRRWWAVAAAALIVVGLSSAGLLQLYRTIKTRTYLARAEEALEGFYSPASPGDLRLDLPFKPAPSNRGSPGNEAVVTAERFFYQALAVRESDRRALLGLGYLHLRMERFAMARSCFQEILQVRSGDPQALLGCGVCRFEEASVSADPMTRAALLQGALDDFAAVIRRQPASEAGRFNMARVLYDLGRHREALQEIDAYLALDPDSLWAVKLRDLRDRIRLNRSEVIDEEVRRAALARDAVAIESLVRAVPHAAPAAIRSALLQSVRVDGDRSRRPEPGPDDMRWSARQMAAAYEAVTEDTSYRGLLEFYDGLSPPRKRLKLALDSSLEKTIEQFYSGSAPALQAGRTLRLQFEELRDYWQLVRLHHLLGNSLYYGKPDFASARMEYEKMLRSAELAGDPDLVARALGALASCAGTQQLYDDSLRYLSQLKKHAASHRMQSWMAFASSSLGAALLELNQVDESLRESSAAFALACRLMDPQTMLVSLEYLGLAMERLQRFSDADRFYRQAAEWQQSLLSEGILKESPETRARRLNLLGKQGHLALQLGDLNGAERNFRRAIDFASGSMREAEARNRIGLARVYLEAKRYAEAAAETGKLREIVSRSDFPEAEWQASTLMALQCRRAGDGTAALRHLTEAVDTLERVRARIPPELRHSFFTGRFNPFREIVSLLHSQRRDPREILDFVDRAKSMTLREYLALHSPAPGPGSMTSFPARSRPLALPPRTLALEYFVTPDETFVFTWGAHGADVFPVGIPAVELNRAATDLVTAMKSNRAPAFDMLARKLHEVLIDPALRSAAWDGVDTLVILPDGPLHLVPFAGLMDRSGHRLIEKYALAYAPSRSILSHCLAADAAGNIAPGASALLLDGTSDLAGASGELARLAGLFGVRSRLVGADGLPSLNSIAGKYEIIHFAGHARTWAGRPRLVFPAAGGERYLDATAVAGWKLRQTHLVTLAGCETAAGPVFDGETAWSLVPAFLDAGAPAVLASLVPVDDAATRMLTSRFYDLMIRRSLSKAAALRQSQLDLLDHDRRNAAADSLSWASFILVGDPR